MLFKGRVAKDKEKTSGEGSPGIFVTDDPGRPPAPDAGPRISAFIWGGKVPPAPTLPYGRWKGAA